MINRFLGMKIACFIIYHNFYGENKMKIHAYLAIVLLWVTGPAMAIPSLDYDGTDITGVSGIIIDGEEWDMTLHDGSFDQIYWGTTVDLLYTHEFAQVATAELKAFFITLEPDIILGNSENFVGCDNLVGCDITTAYSYDSDAGFFQSWSILVFNEDNSAQFLISDATRLSTTDSTGRTHASWARASVPEPPVALLMASGLIAFGVVRRKSRA